jgi:hypothetical protein
MRRSMKDRDACWGDFVANDHPANDRGRSGHLAAEPALWNARWMKRFGWRLASDQSEEVWVGATYALAALMLGRGLVSEAWQTASGAARVTYERGL